MLISGAEYSPVRDLAVVTPYFNPMGYKNRLAHYKRFRQSFDRSGINLVTIEAIMGDREPEIPDAIHLRCNSWLWQKERLINLAIERLPSSVDKVAWVDCDVLFANPDWAALTSAYLEVVPVVQPFTRVIKLLDGVLDYTGLNSCEEGCKSFAWGYQQQPYLHRDRSVRVWAHGHSGYAWAARREVFEKGLYDRMVLGTGDLMMAHGFCGSIDADLVQTSVGDCRPLLHDLLEWQSAIYPQVRGMIRSVAGVALHLWHGKTSDRQYFTRNQQLIALGFDPLRDLSINADGLYEWHESRPDLQEWARSYFQSRNEDVKEGIN